MTRIQTIVRQPFVTVSLLIVFLVCFTVRAFANDTAASIGAGGIVFEKESDISLEEEVLVIGLNKINVSYVFKNLVNNDISRLVAFPLPEFGYPREDSHQNKWFTGLSVVADGKEVTFKTEIRAMANGRDITGLLKSMKLSMADFAGFGHWRENQPKQIEDLSKTDKEKLMEVGAISKEGAPQWKLQVKYYWTQLFPVGRHVRIEHSYTPYAGYFGLNPKDYLSQEQLPDYLMKFNKDACLNGKGLSWIRDVARRTPDEAIHRGSGWIAVQWVDYILTTANNWKGPIKKFHLILESDINTFISSCFKEKFRKVSATRLEFIQSGYIPKEDITVYFLKAKKY